MKCVLLAGGLGTRISEETVTRPKPMVEIGGRPIIWHIMKLYSSHGINDFVVCLGYKGYMLKEYFANYFLHMSDVTIDIANNALEVHQKKGEPWKVTLVDTGENTQTGGRLKRIYDYVDSDFCMTYGDGVGAVDITSLIKFHKAHGKAATMTVVQPPGRFGAVDMAESKVTAFREKPYGEGGWINGGFFVLNKSALSLINSDSVIWEREPLESLVKQDDLRAFRHDGFWQPMDTLRDKLLLEELWQSGKAPWKIWNDS